MKHLVFLLAVLLIFSVSCVKNQKDVLETVFPQCMKEPGVGGTSGVKCDYDEDNSEWRISFWVGSGDCPSGCIKKDYYAFYKVDKKGNVFECDKDYNNLKKVSSEEIIDPPKPPQPSKQEKKYLK